MKKILLLGLVITLSFLSACIPLSHASPLGSHSNSLTTTQAFTEIYILNISSYKIHRPDCRSVRQMKEENKQTYTGALYILLEEGYTTCGHCF